MTEAFRSLIQESGPRGLMQGFQASALRDAPHAGMYVLFYELIKEKTSKFRLCHVLLLLTVGLAILLGPRMPGMQAAIYTWSGE